MYKAPNHHSFYVAQWVYTTRYVYPRDTYKFIGTIKQQPPMARLSLILIENLRDNT